MTPLLQTGEGSMHLVAGKLCCSRQTLFRKLKAEGVTFEQVLDELRHKLSLRLSRREQNLGERDSAPRRLLRLGRLLPRVQAVDGVESARVCLAEWIVTLTIVARSQTPQAARRGEDGKERSGAEGEERPDEVGIVGRCDAHSLK